MQQPQHTATLSKCQQTTSNPMLAGKPNAVGAALKTGWPRGQEGIFSRRTVGIRTSGGFQPTPLLSSLVQPSLGCSGGCARGLQRSATCVPSSASSARKPCAVAIAAQQIGERYEALHAVGGARRPLLRAHESSLALLDALEHCQALQEAQQPGVVRSEERGAQRSTCPQVTGRLPPLAPAAARPSPPSPPLPARPGAAQPLPRGSTQLAAVPTC